MKTIKLWDIESSGWEKDSVDWVIKEGFLEAVIQVLRSKQYEGVRHVVIRMKDISGREGSMCKGSVMGNFPDGLVAETLHCQRRGPRSDPWSGN